MENELVNQIAAIRQAQEIGCHGAHQIATGEWIPCSSTKQFMVLTQGFDVKARMSLEEMRKWSSIRKAKGNKRKKRWEKLKERRMLGIDTLPNGSLVSSNSPISANTINGGNIPSITYGATNPSGLSTKSIQPAYMPRDNDPDVFVDIESARKRAQQLGCIGVSRRMSKGGKTVWMPCTNLTDYNNLTGMTALGRINQAKRNERVVRTVLKEELKKRKKSVSEEILGKSLGPRLRGVGRVITSRFDPKAVDGDNDGLLQDGTPFERPNVPTAKIPQTPKETNISEEAVASVGKWMSSMTPSEKDNFRSEPIESFDGPTSGGGLASRRIELGGMTRNSKKPLKPEKIDGLNNPEASPTNPFRNLGGRGMGRIIRGLVKPENKNKQDRTTFILGGNTGSGKSTVFDSHLVPQGLMPSEKEAAVIDPDFIKKGLVGYNDGEGAGQVHKDSQTATDKIIQDSAEEGMDMVIMGSGASRQISHMREANRRGESVVGHWVHVPQQVASQRIKTRMNETGRYIPDNTAHMANSIPRAISTAFDEDLLDEFYLWDNDVPAGKPPKLIAKKVRGEKFEIFDKAKFEEFAGGKKWADRWVEIADGRESRRGLASVKYTAAEAREYLREIGFDADTEKQAKPEVRLPKNTAIEKFYKERVLPYLRNKSGRAKGHKGGFNGNVVVEDLLEVFGISIDKRRLTDRNYRKNMRNIVLSSDPEILKQIFDDAPIVGPNGESRFGDIRVGDVDVEIGNSAKQNQISKLINEGFTEEEISEMSDEEITGLLEAIDEINNPSDVTSEYGTRTNRSGLASGSTPRAPIVPISRNQFKQERLDKAFPKNPMKPRDDTYKYKESIDLIVSRAVPTSREELLKILAENPFTIQGPKKGTQLIDVIDAMSDANGIDWDEQKELAEVFRRTLESSPELVELLSITDVPPLLSTKYMPNPTFVNDEPLYAPEDWENTYQKVSGMFIWPLGATLYNPNTIKNGGLIDGVTATPEYVIRHELGHAIHAMMMQINPEVFELEVDARYEAYVKRIELLNKMQDIEKLINDELAKPLDQQNKPRIRILTKDLEKKIAMVQRGIQGWHLGEITPVEAKKLTTYASTDSREYVAELIAILTAPIEEIKFQNRRLGKDYSKIKGMKLLSDTQIKHLSKLVGIEYSVLKGLHDGRLDRVNNPNK